VAMRVAKLPMGAVLRTRTTGETRGFMKALLDAHTDRILGFAMFGPEAGEVMAVVPGQSHEKFTGDYRSCSVAEGKGVANNSFPDG